MTDPTRFDLDDRQRAMLAEMGVRVWWPQARAKGDALAEASVSSAAHGAAASDVPVALPPRPVAPVPVAAAAATAPAHRAAPQPPSPAPAPAGAGLVPNPLLPEGLAAMDWAALQSAASACQACDLCHFRQNAVFGVGDTQADWMVIGDAPTEEEDAQGQPFVGPAGQLLDNMLKAVGRHRAGQGAQGAYLSNAIQCRAPSNRNPSVQELANCAPYLSRKVALVQPKLILLMGRFAVQSVLQTTEPMGKLRGQVHHFQGVPVVVTYHPAALLRNPADKAKAWADLVLAMGAAA